MDSRKLLRATDVSHLKREKRIKSTDDSATDEGFAASVLRGDLVWTDNVEDDGQRKTAVGYCRQSPEARKAKKSSDKAPTNGDSGAFVLRSDVD